MSGFFGPTAAEKSAENKQNVSSNNLESVFNFGLPAGEKAQATGTSIENKALNTLGTATQYWQSILSGNRTTNLEAAAPAVNATLNQADAAKRELAATGTGRGGGVNAANQQRETSTRAEIDNTIAMQRPEAARGLESAAGLESQIGSTTLSDSLGLLGLGVNATTADANIQAKLLSEEAGLNESTWSNIGTVAGMAIGATAGGLGGGGLQGALKGSLGIGL